MSRLGPSFDRVYVISDLHMGGPEGRQIFASGDRLARFLDCLASEDGHVALVVNGDSVDFLAEGNATHFDPDGARAKLERIYADPSFHLAWRALEAFVAAGKTLVITLGNHDPELALPDVREWLVDKLTGGDQAARGRVVTAFDGAGFRCNVGDRSILCTHGNEVDNWNVIDYGRLSREVRDVNQGRPPADAWTVNAGTRMVIEVMNEIKRVLPFVDLLKPETQAVIPTLIALRPEFLKKVFAVIGLVGHTKVDKLRIDQRLLGHSEAEASEDVDELEAFARFVGERLGEDMGKIPDDAGALLLEARDGRAETLPDDDALLGAGDYFRPLFGSKARVADRLRRSLENLLESDATFGLQHHDDVFLGMDARVSPGIDYVITGHTHLIRAIERSKGGWYFNSGTWVRVIELTDEMLTEESFDAVWQALQASSLDELDAARVDGAPLVRVRPTGVVIRKEAGSVFGELFEVSDNGEQQPIDGTRMPAHG